MISEKTREFNGAGCSLDGLVQETLYSPFQQQTTITYSTTSTLEPLVTSTAFHTKINPTRDSHA